MSQVKLLIFIALTFLTSSCYSPKQKEEKGTEIKFRYAQLIKLWAYDDYQKIELLNPWDTTQLLQTYLLVEQGKNPPAHLPKGTIIRTPITEAAVFTSVHCAMLHEIGASQAITGVCDLEYILHPAIQEDCQNGRITNLGGSINPDIEKIINLSPKAILLSPFKNSGGHGELDKLGIAIVECADYMERHPLGRAEWIRLYGKLFGREVQADSIFQNVESEYQRIASEAAQQDTLHRPTLLYGLRSGSAWYVPGRESYMAKMFQTAGANYLFNDLDNAGASPLAFESVFEKGYDADIWLFLYNEKEDKTYTSMNFYAPFKSHKERRIYGCNTHKTPYYDDIPFHPEKLLHDLRLLFQSKKTKEDEANLHYYHNLAE